MKRVTLRDVAAMAKTSISTVSRALAGHPDISIDTQERIRVAAKMLKYRPNLNAKYLRQSRSRLIALILPEVNMFHTPSLISGVNDLIRGTEYSLIIFQSNNNYFEEKAIIQKCFNWAIEGALISISENTKNLNNFLELQEAGVDCILLDKTFEGESFISVTIDNKEAAAKAVHHLVEKGHREIIGIFGHTNLSISKERKDGFIHALSTQGIPFRKENFISVDEVEHLYNILPPMLRMKNEITAIFTMTDELLLHSNAILQKMNLKVPSDISLISISDGILPDGLNPRVTHIKDSGRLMGEKAADLLMRCFERVNLKPLSMVLPTTLEEYNSVKTLVN